MKEEQNRISGLIIKAQQGDKSAFEELYNLTSPKAYFVALKICSNEHDAQDILQESYIKILKKIDTVDPNGNFTAWVYQIVANTGKNFLKAKKPVLFGDDEEEIIGNLPDENTDFSPEEHVDREELRNEVMAAVDELTAEKRACVMMMYFGDMSVNEIAQSLEVPVSTVKNRLFTARKDLRNKFEKKGITALYGAAIGGLLIWALSQTGEITAAAFASSAASGAVLAGVSSSAAVSSAAAATTVTSAAASTVSTTAATSTGIAAKVAALSVAQKVVAGVAATAVIGGSTAGVATVAKKIVSSNETTTYIEEVTTAPSQTEEYQFIAIPDDESTTLSIPTVEITGNTSAVRDETSTKRPSAASTTNTAKTTNTTTVTSTTKRTTTTRPTTTRRQTTTRPTTTKTATTTRPTTTRPTTTRPTTTTEPTTEEETTTVPTTTQPTTTQPTTTEPTTQAPATVNVEVVDMDENVVATFSFTVEADTEMTWEYLVTQIKSKGYEPKAGIYGDAVGAVAQSGGNYNITAEL